MTRLKVDALALGLAHDPYPLYARMRAAGPLVPAGPGTFAVPRHREVEELLRDPRLSHRFPDSFRRFAVGDGPTCALLQRIVSSQRPPGHAPVRAWLSGLLATLASERWWAEAAAHVDDRVVALVSEGGFDAVADLAAPLSVDLVCDLLGLDGDARAEVAVIAGVLGRALTALRLSDDDRAASDAAVVRAGELLRARLPELPGAPAGHADAALDNLVFVCFTAIEMIAGALATCCAVLVRHPGELAWLRRTPDGLATAIAELLRFDSPTQGTARLVTEPIEVDGQPVRPGRILFLLLGSANHDEQVFTDPARLDLGRRDNPHLSFGGGPYRCLGASLATRLAEATVGSLLRACAALEPAAAPERHPPSTFCRSYAKIPILAKAV
ncbi:cytochrome P450 [Nonomuraea muscovyensis]|uniref:Cytochrome P450 n=1 Tax=Nonomuraea muscovyensis TaxID=1124761 RepID=A0A7X0EZR0_9ACTN|nr:cytochrome P450 [Nonomuraea muscovyensis]MBB6347794.1 hypothetical protein [Nonomuraea muscovyensis]